MLKLQVEIDMLFSVEPPSSSSVFVGEDFMILWYHSEVQHGFMLCFVFFVGENGLGRVKN